MKYFLGIDDGGTMVKAALFDRQGREIAVSSQKVEILQPQKGFAEVDMDALWAANVSAIRQVLEKSAVSPDEIVCAAVTGHGNGMYLVDAEGKSLVGVRSIDVRAREYVERWTEEKTLEKILPKMTQATWAAQPNALLRWFQDHDPETLEKARWLLMVKDFIRFRLTGEAFLELTDASGTSLINNRTEDYDDEILETWGIAQFRHLLPPLVRTFDICGRITESAARQTGLKVGMPVAGGMFDIDAMGLAVGMTDDKSLCLISGTWGNNQCISRELTASHDIFMTTCYSIPGCYLMLEGSATSASNLEWFITEFFQADKELLKLRNEAGSIYELINELVARTNPEDCELVFLPYLYASPVSMDAKACLYGLDAWQHRGHVLRAVCEGIVFGHSWHIERLLRYREMPEVILLAGGAAKSAVWSQMFADILQTPVRIPDGSELGALGAAIAASVAVEEFPDAQTACQEMVHFSRIFTPDPSKAEIYRKKQQNFRKLISLLQPLW